MPDARSSADYSSPPTPVVLAGAALAGLAQLDPIVLGAMPIGEPRDGRAAAWFVLARWDW